MSRILVTGGAGMIGSNLVKRLVKMGHSPLVVDNLWRGKLDYLLDGENQPVISLENDFAQLDLSMPDVAEEIMTGVEYVIHLADIVGGIGYVFNNQASLFRQNLLINSNVIETARKRRVKGFIYVGTACSFPETMQNDYQATALKESDLYPSMPESAYGWSKLMGNYETMLMGKESGISTAGLLLHNVYGSPADFGVEKSQVIPSLVRKAIQYPDEDFIVWGSGRQGRAFLHVGDVVNAIVLTLDRGLGHGDIQIGPSFSTTIKEIAEMIVKVSGKKIEIQYDIAKPEGDKSRCADYSKAKRILGWEPKTSLEAGISELYHWIENQIRKS